MVYGVFVPSRQEPAIVVRLEPRIGRSDDTCMYGVHADNFTPLGSMHSSLVLARKHCIHHLTRRSFVWDAVFRPLLGRAPNRSWLIVAGVGLIGCLHAFLGRWLWALLPVDLPLALLPGRGTFAVSYLGLLSAVVLSIPREGLLRSLAALLSACREAASPPSLRFYLSAGKSLKVLKTRLDAECFIASVAHYDKADLRLRGLSGGLAFFCAFATAVAKDKGLQEVKGGWQRRLQDPDSHWVPSAVLAKDGALAVIAEDGNPEEQFELRLKLEAIKEFADSHGRNAKTMAVFAWDDETHVQGAWNVVTGQELMPREGPTEGAVTAEAGNVRFLFCESLEAFIRSVDPFKLDCPYTLGWVWTRLGTVALSTILAVLALPVFAFMDPPARPQFTIADGYKCEITRKDWGIHLLDLPPGRTACCQLKVNSVGFPGPFDLELVSNHDGTQRLSRDGEPSRRVAVRTAQRLHLIYLTMPDDPPPGGFVVVVTVSNRGGKEDQQSIFVKPLGASDSQ